MKNRAASPARSARVTSRSTRRKCPVIVVTTTPDQRLTSLYCSTPLVDFLHITVEHPGTEDDFPAPCVAQQLSVSPLLDLPPQLKHALKRAFRRR